MAPRPLFLVPLWIPSSGGSGSRNRGPPVPQVRSVLKTDDDDLSVLGDPSSATSAAAAGATTCLKRRLLLLIPLCCCCCCCLQPQDTKANKQTNKLGRRNARLASKSCCSKLSLCAWENKAFVAACITRLAIGGVAKGGGFRLEQVWNWVNVQHDGNNDQATSISPSLLLSSPFLLSPAPPTPNHPPLITIHTARLPLRRPAMESNSPFAA